MANTHDYVIDNGTGAAVRASLNVVLGEIQALNAGSSAPTTTVAYKLWADTNTGKLKIRNAANNAWIEVGTLASANLGLATTAAPTFTGEVVFNSTGAVQMPSGTDAQRPGSPTNGDLRYNSEQNKFEGRVNGAWSDIGGGGGGATGGDSGANAVFWENQKTVTHDYTLTAARGVGSFGEITINAGKTVTIPADSTWTIV